MTKEDVIRRAAPVLLALVREGREREAQERAADRQVDVGTSSEVVVGRAPRGDFAGGDAA